MWKIVLVTKDKTTGKRKGEKERCVNWGTNDTKHAVIG